MVISVSHLVDNVGSTARDWCMLERNILSHIKLCLLLSLLSASILLHARLSSDPNDAQSPTETSLSILLPVASVLTVSALLALAAGSWDYWSSDRDMRIRRAFMISSKPHTVMLTIVAGVVFGLCLVFLADNNIA